MVIKSRISAENKITHWQNLINEWTNSGLSQAAFCRTRGIAHSNFFNWRKRLSQQKSLPAPTSLFAPIEIKQEESKLCKVSLSTPVVLLLKNNVRLEITSSIDKAALKLVFDVLGVLPC
jgi:transposase-like protein